MIPVSAVTWQSQPTSWQEQLQQAISDPRALCERLQLPAGDSERIIAACHDFPLRVPESFVDRMRPGDPDDPLLRQILPDAAELLNFPDYVSDPLDERNHNPVPGLVHKYGSRVLLIATSLCAVHCRYCFRREFPYNDNRNSRAEWQQALDYIAAHTELNEVILSGGDPLSLPDRQLLWLRHQIAAIPHIRRLRIHTRLPIVIPQRITPESLQWLDSRRAGDALQTVMVLHCNHPNEIDGQVAIAATRLRDAGVTLLNQSVLLRGINNGPDVLTSLSEQLFSINVLPYYLHQLDKVRGSQHFSVPDEDAVTLHRQLQTRLPGFLVPRLVRELPSETSKTWLR